jgi:hypothetical protein
MISGSIVAAKRAAGIEGLDLVLIDRCLPDRYELSEVLTKAKIVLVRDISVHSGYAAERVLFSKEYTLAEEGLSASGIRYGIFEANG